MLDGFLASGLKATVRFVFWPLITLWLPVRWVLERYRKRLQEQMLVEGHSAHKSRLLRRAMARGAATRHRA